MANIGKVFSENVARYRKLAGLTQEELGKAVSVSTQAVSRWEHGGLPDVSLLPAIADTLHVSIDELLGHRTESVGDFFRFMQEDFRATPEPERMSRMFSYAWNLLKCAVSAFPTSGSALISLINSVENVDRRSDSPVPPTSHVTFTTDTGMVLGTYAKDLQYLFLLPEPEEGIASVLKNKEEYLRLFQLLVKPHRLDMLLFLYGPNRAGFSISLAAKKLEISVSLAEEILEELYVMDFVRKNSFHTLEGSVTFYIPLPNVMLVPFLFFAGQLMISCGTTEQLILSRNKPLLEAEPGTNSVMPDWITRDRQYTRELKEGDYFVM